MQHAACIYERIKECATAHDDRVLVMFEVGMDMKYDVRMHFNYMLRHAHAEANNKIYIAQNTTPRW